jgi:HEAT repeat protein/pterin-4a-carbinolamine dehydratase
MENLEKCEIETKTSLLDEKWELIDMPFLKRTFEFDNFKEALDFVNIIADISENLKHHPDIFISYNTVNLNIYTHDTNSVTELDFKLARKIDELSPVEDISLDKDQELLEYIDILKNGSDFEKRKAAIKLGKIEDSKAVSILIKSLNDKDRFVRKAAARSLGKIKDKRAIKPLIRVLGFVDPEFRYAAKDSLVEIGESTENDLISALESSNYHQREMAIEALGELGTKNSNQYLKKGLIDNESHVRWRAARAINQWYDDEVISILKNLSKKDPDNKVRDESIKSLKNIENQISTLYETFIRSIKFIDNTIIVRKTDSGESFLVKGKIFCSSYPYNPTKIHIRLYKGNTRLKGVKDMKDPKWGIIYLQRKEELGDVLEIIKESYIIAKKEYN